MTGGGKPKFIRQQSTQNAVEASQKRDDARKAYLKQQRKASLADNPFTERNKRALQRKYAKAEETLAFLKNVKTDSFGWAVDSIRAKIPDLKKIPPEQWNGWKGSPYTVKTLTYSRTSNAKISNKQEWPKIASNAEIEKKLRMKKETKRGLTRGMTMTPAMLSASEQRKEWQMPDAADRDMVFSRTVRYHNAWRNPQELPDVDIMHEQWLKTSLSAPELAKEKKACQKEKLRQLVPDTMERPVKWTVTYRGKSAEGRRKSKRKKAKNNGLRGALGTPAYHNQNDWNADTHLGDPKRSVNYHEPITAYRQKRVPPKNISGRVLEKLEEQKIAADPSALLERAWKGSPSTFKDLTFSKPSNTHIWNIQAIPSVDTAQPPAYDGLKMAALCDAKNWEVLENAGTKHDVRFIKGSGYGQQVKHQDYGHASFTAKSRDSVTIQEEEVDTSCQVEF